MKKNDTARQCAKRLAEKDVMLEKATDFYLRHLQRKKSTGRKPGSGVFSGSDPQREQWTEFRNRIIYGTPYWRIVRLRELIPDWIAKRKRSELEALRKMLLT